MAEIRVENLSKSFGDFVAVRDSTFTVANGDPRKQDARAPTNIAVGGAKLGHRITFRLGVFLTHPRYQSPIVQRFEEPWIGLGKHAKRPLDEAISAGVIAGKGERRAKQQVPCGAAFV